jgi:hypothetical protein
VLLVLLVLRWSVLAMWRVFQWGVAVTKGASG